jgi:hypothetical protein
MELLPVNRLRLIVLLHAVIAALLSLQMQQQQAFAALVFAAMYVRRRRVKQRSPPSVYVRARSTMWTRIVLRSDLFEDSRFKFFFRVGRSRFETILQGVGHPLNGTDTRMKDAVRVQGTQLLRVCNGKHASLDSTSQIRQEVKILVGLWCLAHGEGYICADWRTVWFGLLQCS